MITRKVFYIETMFREKFGLHSVDFDDPSRPRTPKASSQFLKEIVTNNGFVEKNE